MELTGYRGTVMAEIGDRFQMNGAVWEIRSFTGPRIYSPSGLGGCPIVIARFVRGKLDAVFAKYTVNGICEICGDSVASALIRARDAIERGDHITHKER